MRVRILSPLEEKIGVVGLLWMDCDFEKLPNQTDSLEFLPQGKNSIVDKIIVADKNISPPDIDFILITGALVFSAGAADVKHSANLISQGWRRESEENEQWPEYPDKVGFWMAEVDFSRPAFMRSWARAVAAKRNATVFKCNRAELFNSSWKIRPN